MSVKEDETFKRTPSSHRRSVKGGFQISALRRKLAFASRVVANQSRLKFSVANVASAADFKRKLGSPPPQLSQDVDIVHIHVSAS